MTHIDVTSASLLSALGTASIKAALILALASLAAAVLRRRSAALRHLIWTIALGATVAVLILPAALPAWRVVPLPAVSFDVASTAPHGSAAARFSFPSVDRDVDTSTSPASPSRTPAVAPTTTLTPGAIARTAADHWPSLVFTLWLLGAVVVLARYAFSTLALHLLTRHASALDGVTDPAIGRDVISVLGLGRTVRFLKSDDVELPLTWGIFRPRVLLPGNASEWSATRVAYVLQHELAHVKRLDAGTQLIAYTASAIFWFHPLVWHAGRQMRHERERACDDDVLAQGAVASEYASDLLALVRSYGNVDHHSAALAMARRSQFEGRLLALLDPTVEHRAVSILHMVATLALAVLIVVPVAALRGAKAAPSSSTLTVAAPRPASDPMVARTIAVAPAPVPASPHRAPELTNAADLFADCSASGSSHDDRDLVDSQLLWTASAADGECSYSMTAHGDVTFNSDVTAIADIPADGDIEIGTNVRGAITHLMARRDTAGAIAYEFSRNGATADFATEGQAWLAGFLVTLDRHTAFAIDRRLPLLLQSGGPALVLAEIDRMRTNHPRTIYLVGLANAETLNTDMLRRVFDESGRLRSDHDKLDVLLAVARSQSLSGTTRNDYVNAASTLQLDSERRRAFNAIAHR
jgi:beta-lactamase regulating signal transducer with metallopeptidase domain